MAQVDSENITALRAHPAGASSERPGPKSPREAGATSGATPSPAWQYAIIRLANATERVANHIAVVLEQPLGEADYVRGLRDLVRDAIDTLDQLDGDADLEDGGYDEPSLGSHEAYSGAGVYLPSLAAGAGYDVEEQSDDEGVMA
ncbi:hypothetical protein [Bradyrhizobium sp. 18]|uniref:hypothetical protein n=1 Tax=Bradyrhizobium sp. 18 TaxID=2782657 RepID=UPI001FF715F9|nr:hypothetical protein [Bradyrhizobium sp. 18]MCK1507197.1 hypothetical protein [Bradyrhizobium sp. 18]